MKNNRKVMLLALLGAVLHSALYWSGLLSTGWAILVATLGSAILVEIVYAKKGSES